MHRPTPVSAEASAHALAMIVASNGRIEDSELQALDQLEAFRRLGVRRERFVELAHSCVRDVGAQLCERSWLCADHLAYIDALLDAVPPSGESRMLVCRLAAAVVTADGHVSDDERLVWDHALARWHITEASVTQAILHDSVR